MVEQRNKLLFIVMLAILIVAGSFYSFWQKNTVEEVVSSSDDVAAKNDFRQPERSDKVFVYISGAVHKPGVFKASGNARVFDIVEMAGGLTAEADVAKTNLAQGIKDGMHIHVVDKLPVSNEHSATTGITTTKVGNKVNINHADKGELDTLPGVGPALAERIIEYRQANGSFSSIDELKNVPGIGSSKFEKMKEKITN